MKRNLFLMAIVFSGGLAIAAPESTARKSSATLPGLVYRSNRVYSALEAAAAGNAEVLKARIQDGFNVNQKDENGNVALHYAMLADSTECVSELLKAGAQLTMVHQSGKTAHEMSKSKKMLKLLKQAATRRDKEIQLCEQIAAGNLEPLKKAIKQKGFNPNMLDKDNNLSVLMLVCTQKDTRSLAALLKAGANVNYTSPDSRSVLHKAVDSDSAGIITALLKAGADPMARANNQAVALHDAVWNARTESVKALLPAYKDVNFSPPGGFNGTPVNLAIDRGHPQVVQLFIEAGINLDDNTHGDPPLVHAAANGKADFVTLLLKAGADKHAKGQQGKSAVEVAADSVRHLF